MKVSEWLRQYQITGEVPTAPAGEELIAFWAGYLTGVPIRSGQTVTTPTERMEMAIKAAEFIEEHAR
jgi:hypothetical protein